MSSNLTSIRVYKDDKKRIKKECRVEFLDSNPKFKGVKITYHFLIKKMIEYYLKN